MADDYACLTKGLLDLFEATGHTPHLAWAKRLQVKKDGDYDGAKGCR